MAAVPKEDRLLNHVSKPLRRQMKKEIDRGRYPVLVTFHDEGQGHNGHVYKCSGWEKTTRRKVKIYEDSDGQRTSRYKNGITNVKGLEFKGHTFIQRWEHWNCERGNALVEMENNGWVRVPIPGKKWRSGNQAYTFVRR